MQGRFAVNFRPGKIGNNPTAGFQHTFGKTGVGGFVLVPKRNVAVKAH